MVSNDKTRAASSKALRLFAHRSLACSRHSSATLQLDTCITGIIIVALSNNMDSFMNTDIFGDKLPVVIACFVFLGIERLLYGYCYHFTEHFKQSVRRGSFGPKIQAEPLYWRCMMELGKWIKVFQFSVFIFDWIVRKNVSDDLLTPAEWSVERTTRFGMGLFLVLLGQFLNVAVFRALTPKGVYYGYEL